MQTFSVQNDNNRGTARAMWARSARRVRMAFEPGGWKTVRADFMTLLWSVLLLGLLATSAFIPGMTLSLVLACIGMWLAGTVVLFTVLFWAGMPPGFWPWPFRSLVNDFDPVREAMLAWKRDVEGSWSSIVGAAGLYQEYPDADIGVAPLCPALEDIEIFPAHVMVTLSVASGYSIETVTSRLSELASAWGTPNVIVENIDFLTVRLRVPFSDAFVEGYLVAGPVLAGTDSSGVIIGSDASKTPIVVDPANRSGLLLTGVPGSGKTATVQYLVASWLTLGAEVVIVDFKDGGDYQAFRNSAQVLGDDMQGAVVVLRAVERGLRDRLSAARETDAPNFWNRPISERPPLVVLVLDEVQELLETSGVSNERKVLAQEAQSLLKTVLKRGRAAGVFTVLATQKADASAIPTSIRDQVSIRISGEQKTREASRAALGELRENEPAPHDPVVIPPGTSGRLIIAGDRPVATVFQAFYLPGSALRASLGTLSPTNSPTPS